MHVAIVGAGFSGLVTASTLIAFGHSVVIYDAAPDVGGVWSRVRRYPGIRSQNPRDTYALSTLRMPSDFPLHPKGDQVQSYLEQYARLHKLDQDGRLQLGTKVVRAKQVSSGWEIETRSTSGDSQVGHCDHLVVATGVYNTPNIPEMPGSDEFFAAGGRILHSSQLHSLDIVNDKQTIVLGYGKSACDAAIEIARVAKSITLVAKGVFWKVPTYVGGVLHYSYLFLTRLGEALFRWIRPWKTQRFFDTIGSPIRRFLFSTVGQITSIQYGLKKLGLLPDIPFETVARSTVSLVTPGLFEAISSGQISVSLGVIESLRPGSVSLSDGSVLPAEVVVCGTGWTHNVPSFLPRELDTLLTDSRGSWLLHRHILPIGVPSLSFIGFASSLFCPLTSEISALWLAAHLADVPLLHLPGVEEQRRLAEEESRWLEDRAKGKHAKATSIVPFSLSHIDELLGDLGVGLSRWDHLKEWLLPIDPSAYKGLVPKVLRRQAELKAKPSWGMLSSGGLFCSPGHTAK